MVLRRSYCHSIYITNVAFRFIYLSNYLLFNKQNKFIKNANSIYVICIDTVYCIESAS